MQSSPMGALRVLLVSPQEDLREEAREALATMGRPSEISWASQPDLALSRAEQLVPDVVLVDDDLDGISVPALIKEMTVCVPSAVILSLVEPHAVQEASRAVLAGARAFIFKPLRADDLVASLREILNQRPVERQSRHERASGRVIVFCAPRGGTGRTTLAINTAISLQMAGQEPLVLIDADYATPALDVALNLHSQRTISDLLPRLSRLDEDFLSGVLAQHVSGIRVLLAPPPTGPLVDISLPEIQRILGLLKRTFSWVIVDLGLQLDESALAFLESADRIVMSVVPEMISLRNARLMLEALYRHGHADEKIWLVINRATMAEGISVREIERQLHTSVRFRIPDDQPLATHSINRGVPMVMSHRRGAVIRAFRNLALHILEELPTKVEIPGVPFRVARRAMEDTGAMGSLRSGSAELALRPS